MKKYFILFAFAVALSSCTVKDNGDLAVSDFGWVVIIFSVFMFIFLGISGSKEEKKTKESLSKQGLRVSNFRAVGKFVGGHPKYDKEVLRVSVRDDSNKLSFYEHLSTISMPSFCFDIQKDNIKSITIEDSSSIEKKITLGRVLLVGVFAFAWRKKKIKEVAFLVIEWSDGRFDHSTVFVNEGKSAMEEANATRNYLIKLIG